VGHSKNADALDQNPRPLGSEPYSGEIIPIEWRKVGYLIIKEGAEKNVSKLFTNDELCAAIRCLDQPEDWQKLLEIGELLSQHFRQKLIDWVDDYILEMPV
jgi:hypothetical protein